MIEVIDNFLPNDLIGELHKQTVTLMTSQHEVFSTNYWWNEKLRKGNPTPSPILIHNLRHPDSRHLHKKVVEFMGERLPEMEVMGVLFHMMTPGAFIGEHRDYHPTDRTHALTIYLNTSEWTLDNGGVLRYNDTINNEKGYVIPKYNRAVLLGGLVHHEVEPVSHGHVRKSLQLWLKQRD